MTKMQRPIGNAWAYLDRNRPRRAVFYGRVSTEHEAQLSALENQMQWYEDQAKYHPNWTIVGKYIDEGITGTQAKKRPSFLEMLEDARAGKCDLIVTREVCRFARNTVDTLVTTRELKNIGVEVYFVEDNIWTMDGDGELRLTIMALNASGENKWNHGVISRILNNQTYMGIMAYGKSYSNNYLDQKRVNNFDKSTYLYMKGDFPAIVTEEEWNQVQAIKAGRMQASFSPNAKKPVHGKKENHDLWGSRMQCACGCSFRKNRWHRNANAPDSFGYQCYNILNNGSGKQRREAGADDTGYCDQPMIAGWKLEMMGKAILEQVFCEQRELIQHTIDLIRQCYRTQKPKESNLVGITARMEQVKAKKERLLDMRTDGEITKEEFLTQRQKLDAELQNLTAEYEKLTRMRRKRTSTSPSGAGFRKPWNKFWIYPSRNPVPT